jgi:hypothetical protein
MEKIKGEEFRYSLVKLIVVESARKIGKVDGYSKENQYTITYLKVTLLRFGIFNIGLGNKLSPFKVMIKSLPIG